MEFKKFDATLCLAAGCPALGRSGKDYECRYGLTAKAHNYAVDKDKRQPVTAKNCQRGEVPTAEFFIG